MHGVLTFMRYLNGRLFVSVDTEPDCDLKWKRSNPLTFTSVTYGIPKLLRPIWNKYRISPIYFVSPEVVMNEECCKVLKEEIEKGAIIGSHLHSEYIEPNITITDPAGKPSSEYPCYAHSEDIETKKIENLTKLIQKNIGVKPIWYRAARYGADLDTIKSLAKLGYRYDSSATPDIDWSKQGGPNHSRAPKQPYYISNQDFYTPAKDKKNGLGIIEVPITISGKRGGILGKVLPNSWLFYRWLRPTHMTLWESKAIIREFKKTHDSATLMMMFHSMEVIPEATPFIRNKFMQKEFLKRLEKTIEFAQRDP